MSGLAITAVCTALAALAAAGLVWGVWTEFGHCSGLGLRVSGAAWEWVAILGVPALVALGLYVMAKVMDR